VPARRQFLLHHQALGDRFRTVFRERLQQQPPEHYAQVPAPVWQPHWNFGCQAGGSRVSIKDRHDKQKAGGTISKTFPGGFNHGLE
jgi:hypothetical protein